MEAIFNASNLLASLLASPLYELAVLLALSDMSIEYSQQQAKLLAMLLEAMGLCAALLCSCTWRAGCCYRFLVGLLVVIDLNGLFILVLFGSCCVRFRILFFFTV